MVNWDLISIIIFYSIILIFYFTHKNKFIVQAKIFALYKTKLGLKTMEKIANAFPRFLKYLSYTGIGVGFMGMVFMLYILVKETLALIFIPGTQPAIAPVLPGIDIPGAPALSFWHWVIAIFITAVIHEFSHGVIAKLHKVKVKSSGFAFMGPILAAFVEPNEKTLAKKTPAQQLSIFAAGPFSNILLGILILLFSLFIFSPLVSDIYDGQGITVNELMEDYPVYELDVETPFTITEINGEETLDALSFSEVVLTLKPGEEVTFTTDQGDILVTPAEHPENSSIAFFGISGLEQEQELKENYSYLAPFENTISWFALLLLWLFIINIGIGLFNLLPLGPVDGGRMLYTASLFFFKDEIKAKKLLTIVSFFVLAIIIINMIPWLSKFFVWIWSISTLILALFI